MCSSIIIITIENIPVKVQRAETKGIKDTGFYMAEAEVTMKSSS